MPRGDGTGPLGTGPIGRGRGGCRGFGRGRGFGRSLQGGIVGNSTVNSDELENEATRLEEQAARLRGLANKGRKAE